MTEKGIEKKIIRKDEKKSLQIKEESKNIILTYLCATFILYHLTDFIHTYPKVLEVLGIIFS